MKEEIIKLRKQGKSYLEIEKIIGLSKSTISYHCKKFGINGRIDGKDLTKINLKELNDFYKTHTIKETAKYFNIGFNSVKKLTNNKNKKLTKEEKKNYNYNHVKNFRQKNKKRAVDYKGGKCIKCNYDKCTSALEFHHKYPAQKDFSLSKNMNKSWNKIKIELDKCILVCANCHREIHEELFASISSV